MIILSEFELVGAPSLLVFFILRKFSLAFFVSKILGSSGVDGGPIVIALENQPHGSCAECVVKFVKESIMSSPLADYFRLVLFVQTYGFPDSYLEGKEYGRVTAMYFDHGLIAEGMRLAIYFERTSVISNEILDGFNAGIGSR
ncbi:hypothetical protein D2Q93_08690 [Alicyclobacillaceae bacterium I2511]|nr:hypothetical protein D2Q93_08690 [Alicyclobacillaceae bacterium I2511]